MRLEDKWTLPTDCSEWLAHELRCRIFDWNDKFRIAFSFGPLHSLRFASFAVHTTISPPSFILMEHLKLFSLVVARKIIYGLCDQLELAEILIFCTSIKMLKVLFLPSIAEFSVCSCVWGAGGVVVYWLICDILAEMANANFDKSPLLFSHIPQVPPTTFTYNLFIPDQTLQTVCNLIERAW